MSIHKPARYQGLFPVVPTPFTENGALDLASQKRCVDFMIDAALLAREVQLARVGEGGGHHRKHALVPGSHGAHSTMLKSLRNSVFMVRPRPGLLSSSCKKPFSATGSPSKM